MGEVNISEIQDTHGTQHINSNNKATKNHNNYIWWSIFKQG